ncbi:E3 ubiquitin-protein ligase UBR4-like [Oopsacas minuta]|uniref:E3 ubiquitin-protein ligase UBR4-like n=1 Tax=Oopsacas minuta TaxID=111878 RepID=A0AAV7JYD2_9METZ|nr:E3 ubiquitin-protein ligase UBR4-like [Oopsacas minuta]
MILDIIFCFLAKFLLLLNYSLGLTLKDIILESGLVNAAIDYLKEFTPTFVFAQHSQDWDSFLSKPSLTYILRFLGGVCIDHAICQRLIAQIIPQIHLTEKATTSKGIGSLAENLLNNLTSESFRDEVIKSRKDTDSQMIHLAQAFKERSLAELGISIANGKVCLQVLIYFISLLI